MVNLCINLTELRDAQMAGKTLFLGCVSEDVSRRDYRLNQLTAYRRSPTPMWAWMHAHMHSCWGHECIKRKGEFALLLELGHPSFPALRHWYSWYSDPWTQIGTYIDTPGAQVFKFVLKLQVYHLILWASSLQTANYGTSWTQ